MLRTDRLVLSSIVPDDYPELAAIAASREIADTTISVPHPLTLSAARDWVERECELVRKGSAVVCVVRQTAERAPIGLVSLRHIDHEHACAELSFWLASAARGRGYATEAVTALLHYGFTTLNLHRIEAYHMVRNAASRRLLAQVGFCFEGTLRERVLKWGRREDAHLWSTLRGDKAPPQLKIGASG